MSLAKLAKTPVTGASTPILTGPWAAAGAAATSIANSERPAAAIRMRGCRCMIYPLRRSRSLERGQDVLGEQRDVLLRFFVRQAAELEEAHDHPGSQLAHLGLDLA